jgi:hypothetical protein
MSTAGDEEIKSDKMGGPSDLPYIVQWNDASALKESLRICLMPIGSMCLHNTHTHYMLHAVRTTPQLIEKTHDE